MLISFLFFLFFQKKRTSPDLFLFFLCNPFLNSIYHCLKNLDSCIIFIISFYNNPWR